MPKESKNGKALSEETLDEVSGGGNFRHGFKIPRDVLGTGFKGYPNPLTRKKDINSLPKTPNIEL